MCNDVKNIWFPDDHVLSQLPGKDKNGLSRVVYNWSQVRGMA